MTPDVWVVIWRGISLFMLITYSLAWKRTWSGGRSPGILDLFFGAVMLLVSCILFAAAWWSS